jgi:hypothetical protein
VTSEKGLLLRAQGWVHRGAAGRGAFLPSIEKEVLFGLRDSFCVLEPESIRPNSTQAVYSGFGISSL